MSYEIDQEVAIIHAPSNIILTVARIIGIQGNKVILSGNSVWSLKTGQLSKTSVRYFGGFTNSERSILNTIFSGKYIEDTQIKRNLGDEKALFLKNTFAGFDFGDDWFIVAAKSCAGLPKLNNAKCGSKTMYINDEADVGDNLKEVLSNLASSIPENAIISSIDGSELCYSFPIDDHYSYHNKDIFNKFVEDFNALRIKSDADYSAWNDEQVRLEDIESKIEDLKLQASNIPTEYNA
jgi:hypothetical protein